MEVVATAGAIRRTNLQSKGHHQQTNTDESAVLIHRATVKHTKSRERLSVRCDSGSQRTLNYVYELADSVHLTAVGCTVRAYRSVAPHCKQTETTTTEAE